MKPIKIKGRCWVIPQHDIDTDMIYHNAYLAITDIKEMGQFTFSNLKGWEDFPKKAQPQDIIVTGRNFGAGSSRQQAVDCFLSLGIGAILAESFAPIYKRNAINSALPIMVVKDVLSQGITSGDLLEIDFTTGKILNLTTNQEIKYGEKFSSIQLEIYQKGGIFKVKPQE